jgi:hypothetical protein
MRLATIRVSSRFVGRFPPPLTMTVVVPQEALIPGESLPNSAPPAPTLATAIVEPVPPGAVVIPAVGAPDEPQHVQRPTGAISQPPSATTGAPASSGDGGLNPAAIPRKKKPGRPRQDRVTRALADRENGVSWNTIFHRDIPDYRNLTPEARKAAEVRLQSAVWARKKAAREKVRL